MIFSFGLRALPHVLVGRYFRCYGVARPPLADEQSVGHFGLSGFQEVSGLIASCSAGLSLR